MRSTLRRFVAFPALLALLYAAVPTTSWACPLTGLIGTGPEICAPAAALVQRSLGAQPLCCPGFSAANRLSPATSSNFEFGDCCRLLLSYNSLPATMIPDRSRGRFLPRFQTVGAPYVAGLGASLVVSIAANACRGSTAIAPLHSQRAASLHSGRAPPVALKSM